jgi:hypothetical protein
MQNLLHYSNPLFIYIIQLTKIATEKREFTKEIIE